MEETQEAEPPQRAAVYIDGFNLYHPIREMNEPHLKWCNLWRLSELLCAPKKLQLQKVVFCTAMPLHNVESLGRHRVFNNAQIACGVVVIEGHYIYNDDLGRYSEKQSDINVALSVIVDGVDDIYDWAFIISADSDQAATARVFKERFPHKSLAVVAPPDRRPPDKTMPYADLSFSITKIQIEQTLLPNFVSTKEGRFVRRPVEYDPPPGWLAPDDRPKRKR